MKFGITVGNFGTFGKRGGVQEQLALARYAELLGFDSVWVHDHLFMPVAIKARYPYNEAGSAGFAYRQDIHDPLAMMAALAVRTKRVSIGTSVLIIPYRNPVVLAKMLATLDCLSHGRILLGAGTGWMEDEFRELGIGSYYPVRGAVADEWLRICVELWTSPGPSSFRGKFHSFEGVGAWPKPVQKPHIPIWIGGNAQPAHRRVARYATGYQTISATPPEIVQQLHALSAELDRRGRNLKEITVSMLGPRIVIGENGARVQTPTVSGSRQAIIDRLGEYAQAGLQHAIATPSFASATQSTPESAMEAMQYMAEEVIPALRQPTGPH